MANYVIGDLQGCFDEFMALLKKVAFAPDKDTLWLLGDLVNRGPKSLQTLRYVMGLGESARTVLGNHDLHFLAVYYGGHETKRSDTLDELLSAADVDEIASWLRSQPLLQEQQELGWLMVHAGVPPLWTLEETRLRAQEAQRFYAGSGGAEFFAGMYGNVPARWSDDLAGLARMRCIVNYLTRMRLVARDGTLDFDLKGAPSVLPEGFLPWFSQDRPEALGVRVAFGHWAALEGQTDDLEYITDEAIPQVPQLEVAALDTGCVWGRELTALCLESGKRVAVAAGERG